METDDLSTFKNVTIISRLIWSISNKNINDKSHVENNINAQKRQKEVKQETFESEG